MSTVPEVLAALAAMGAATLPTGAQVIAGDLGSVTTTRGRLFLVGDQEFEILWEFDSLGGVTVTEHFVVPCAVVADVQTPEQAIADAQAWADFEALHTAIEADPTLGLSGTFSLNAAVVGPGTFRRLGDSEGRHSLVRFGVDVFAAND